MNIRKNITIAKGYRLKPQTHKLIKKIQKQLKGSQEEIISEALKSYSIKLRNGKNQNINHKQEGQLK
jgi:hypothetical protein